MNFVDFKSKVKTALFGDRRALPDDEMIKNLLEEKLRVVAEEYEPLALTAPRKDSDILKKLENGQYILKPTIPTEDTDNIKMDEGLMYVVVYAVAKKLASSKFKDDHNDTMWEHINNYVWERYETDLNTDDHVDSTTTVLDEYGYKKIYTHRTVTSSGYAYEWDKNFISILNEYFMGKIDYELTKSDRNNLDKYISFANGTLESSDEDYEAFEQINTYIGEL